MKKLSRKKSNLTYNKMIHKKAGNLFEDKKKDRNKKKICWNKNGIYK